MVLKQKITATGADRIKANLESTGVGICFPLTLGIEEVVPKFTEIMEQKETEETKVCDKFLKPCPKTFCDFRAVPLSLPIW